MATSRAPIGVLLSGGLDSAILVHRLLAAGARVWPVYLRCGLSWETAELYWLTRFLRAVRAPRLAPLLVIDVPLRSTYGSHWSVTGRHVPDATSEDRAVYLPGRNVLLLSHAAVAAMQRRVHTLAIGTLKGNPFRDASPHFFTHLAACLTQALGVTIRIHAPLRRLTKPQLIRAASEIPLQLTFSCLQPRGYRHCGRCNKCAERRRAFREACVLDPTRYV